MRTAFDPAAWPSARCVAAPAGSASPRPPLPPTPPLGPIQRKQRRRSIGIRAARSHRFTRSSPSIRQRIGPGARARRGSRERGSAVRQCRSCSRTISRAPDRCRRPPEASPSRAMSPAATRRWSRGCAAAGAVIVGKTNLSEWANIRSSNSISGLERCRRPDPQSLRARPQSVRLVERQRRRRRGGNGAGSDRHRDRRIDHLPGRRSTASSA